MLHVPEKYTGRMKWMKSVGQLAECKQPTITIRHLVNNTDRYKLQNCVTVPVIIICSL